MLATDSNAALAPSRVSVAWAVRRLGQMSSAIDGTPEASEPTGEVVGAAVAVHGALGPGFTEITYENALVVELRARRVPHATQVWIPVSYRGVIVGRHRIDVLVADAIVVEMKAVKEILNIHFAVVRSYMRAAGCRHGLILNFAKPVLEAKHLHAW